MSDVPYDDCVDPEYADVCVFPTGVNPGSDGITGAGVDGFGDAPPGADVDVDPTRLPEVVAEDGIDPVTAGDEAMGDDVEPPYCPLAPFSNDANSSLKAD